MKFKTFGTICLSLMLAIAALPVNAQTVRRGGSVNGSNGGRAANGRVVTENSDGGYTFGRGGAARGANGGATAGGILVETDGGGNVTYSGARAGVNSDGNYGTVTTEGSGGYEAETGYSGQGSTTVNGQTYGTSTSNGSTTVTNPDGESTTYTRRRR